MSPKPSDRLKFTRKTGETSAEVSLQFLSGPVEADGDIGDIGGISTGIPFLDHMLLAMRTQCIGTFSRFALKIDGDTEVDDHHTVEDSAISLGKAFRIAVDEVAGIKRFGWCYVPMDEALVRVAIDIGGRAWCVTSLNLRRDQIGGIATENFSHFFQSFAQEMRCNLHIDVIRGENDHHKIEAAFKGLGMALSQALAIDSQFNGEKTTRSSKGKVKEEIEWST